MLLLGGLSLALVIALSSLPQAIARDSDPAAIAQSIDPTPESLVERGRSRYAAGDYVTAAQQWQAAADLFGAAGNRRQQAISLNQVAQAYQQLGRWQAAEAAIANSLAIWENAPPLSAEQQQIVGQTWNLRGALALAQSQPVAAIAAFEQATQYYQTAQAVDGLLRTRINQARALQAMGHYRRAIALLTSIEPPLTTQSPSHLTTVGLKTLGDLHRAIGELSISQTLLEQSLQLAQQLELQPARVAAQLSLGHTAAALGNPDEARSRYEQIIHSDAELQLTVQAQVALLSLLAEANDDAAIEDLLNQLIPTLAELVPGRLRTYAYLDVATSLANLPSATHRKMAADWLNQARLEARSMGDLRGQSYAVGLLGKLYLEAQRWDEAQTLTNRALTLAVQAKAPEISYRWNAQLGALKRELGAPEAAISDYTVAFNTLQTLRTDLVAIDDDVRFNFREVIEPIYRNLVDLLTATPQVTQTDLRQARSVIESLQLAELENFFREACIAVSQDIDQVVDRTAQATAVLYPIVLPNRLEVIFKLPQQPLIHYATPIAQADLEAQLAQLREDLVRPYTLRTVQAQATKLYDWLIKPVQGQLAEAQIQTLVFVLDGALRNVPMGLLYNGERYLIEDYGIAIAPGLQLVDPQPLPNQSLAAVTAGLSQARHGFSPLPYVEAEVTQVKESLSSQVLLNQTFTENNLARTIQESPFPVVHLATHGQFSSDPDETFILAWDKPILLQNLNSILRNSEQSRESAIELLVLSACETASGDQRATLGLAGVAVRAGARSTLASLWNLDDETTAILIDEFYTALKEAGATRAEALRAAQKALLNNPRYEHPRYWAPYVLVGNWL